MKPNKYEIYVCPYGKSDGKSTKKNILNDSSIAGVSGRYCKNNCSKYLTCKRWNK